MILLFEFKINFDKSFNRLFLKGNMEKSSYRDLLTVN